MNAAEQQAFDKMREALEEIANESVCNIWSARIVARVALSAAKASLTDALREKAYSGSLAQLVKDRDCEIERLQDIGMQRALRIAQDQAKTDCLLAVIQRACTDGLQGLEDAWHELMPDEDRLVISYRAIPDGRAAVRTLMGMGYHGGELWVPPLGVPQRAYSLGVDCAGCGPKMDPAEQALTVENNTAKNDEAASGDILLGSSSS